MDDLSQLTRLCPVLRIENNSKTARRDPFQACIGAVGHGEHGMLVTAYANLGGLQEGDGIRLGFVTNVDRVSNDQRMSTVSRTSHICLMATYNQWMNAKVYEAARGLPEAELGADRKAFFGSILGTLNHLTAGDIVWLKRFAQHPAQYLALEPARALPAPKRLDQLLFPGFEELAAHRVWLDQIITEWSRTVTESDLDHPLHYASMQGIPADRNFYGLVMHFFNHQTHHRGQVTTLLSQAGVDVGATDLVVLIPDEHHT